MRPLQLTLRRDTRGLWRVTVPWGKDFRGDRRTFSIDDPTLVLLLESLVDTALDEGDPFP